MNLMPRTLKLLASTLLALTLAPAAFAQSTETKAPKAASAHEQESDSGQNVLKTYFLANSTDQHDANEILIALRNLLPSDVKLYLVNSQNAIVLSASPEQQALAQRLIKELDRPHKSYRLTFTLADSDNGKRVGVQHFSIIVAAGQRTTLKQGSKIPVITGSYSGGTPGPGVQTQFQYLDIGMNFDVSLSDSPGGLLLKAKVEDSSVASSSEYSNSSGPLAQEPIVNQTSLEGTSMVTPGKPLTLGSVDVPGSSRHIDVEVVAEPIS